MSHAPGPWEAMEYAINKNLLTVYGANGTPVCNIFVTDRERDLANARIIAATTDLLETCEAEAAFWQHYNDCQKCAGTLFCDEAMILALVARGLRASALSRARGE